MLRFVKVWNLIKPQIDLYIATGRTTENYRLKLEYIDGI
nr:MAG TPA: hypothetical protein [Caudoviricetes sp.]